MSSCVPVSHQPLLKAALSLGAASSGKFLLFPGWGQLDICEGQCVCPPLHIEHQFPPQGDMALGPGSADGTGWDTSSFVFSPPSYWREVGGLDGDRASGEKPNSQMTVQQAPYPTCIGLGRRQSKLLSCYNSPWLAYLQTRLEDRCISELPWSLQSLVGDVHRISEWKRSVTSLGIASAQCFPSLVSTRGRRKKGLR